MINHTKLSVLFVVISMLTTNLFAQKNTIEPADIEKLIGEWNGTLSYLDYSSNETYSMPTNLKIYSKKENKKLILTYTYPNEPKANTKGKLKISKDKSILNGKNIISRKILPDNNIEIITEYSGKDGNERKAALIRNIYIIGENTLIFRKEVQFNNTEKWMERNEYNFVSKSDLIKTQN